MNLWKDIPACNGSQRFANVVIEVMSGSRDKYEYKEKWEAFVLDRVLYSSVVFPVEYGFVPQTWYHDNDPLDAMVLSYEPLEVGCIVETRAIGALIMEDEKGEDPKILTVPTHDPRFDGYIGLSDIHPHRLREIQEFFEVYKRLEPNKWVKFRAWKSAEEAEKLVKEAIGLFEQKITSEKHMKT